MMGVDEHFGLGRHGKKTKKKSCRIVAENESDSFQQHHQRSLSRLGRPQDIEHLSDNNGRV